MIEASTQFMVGRLSTESGKCNSFNLDGIFGNDSGKTVAEIACDLDLSASSCSQLADPRLTQAGMAGASSQRRSAKSCSGCAARTSSCRWSAKS